MELRHLKYFLTLADELHFGRAADKLFIAQPPLSRQIKNLEEELGVELFRRTKKNVELTQYGKYLKEESVKIFQHLEFIQDRLNLIKEGVVGEIKIGYVGTAMHSIVPKILTKLKKQQPEIKIGISALKNDEQIEALRKRAIDIGFLRTPLNEHDLKIIPIHSEPFSLVLPQSHLLIKSHQVHLKNLAGEPFISFCRLCASGMFDQIIGMCRREGFTPRIVHESSLINSIIRLVEGNLGYSIVPTSVKEGYNLKIKFFELDQYPERAELALAYHPAYVTSVTQKTIDLILDNLD